jgi:hypothetical protein
MPAMDLKMFDHLRTNVPDWVKPKPSKRRTLKDDFARGKEISDEIMKSVSEQMAPRRNMMEEFARHVLALGYQPSECLLEYQQGTHSMDRPSVEYDRLYVLGELCFEIKVTRSPWVDFTSTLTTEPRVVKYPCDRSNCAPGNAHVPMIGVGPQT